ncbi:MAG: hypothetical protein NUV34_11075, partial [Sulfuricaulis sp.]|nr:hypothetical protein [Sulfuricaulis sp.]
MIMNNHVMPVVFMLCATLLPVPHQASAATDGETSVILGAEYTSGDYGTSSKTKIWYFPVTLRYETDANAASVTVSYLSVEGRGDVVVTGGGMGMGSQTVKRTSTVNGTRTDSGFGDVILTGSHKLSGTAASRIDLTGKIKLGTADETDNLGTGENDYAVQLDFEKDYNSNSMFGTAGSAMFSPSVSWPFTLSPSATVYALNSFTRTFAFASNSVWSFLVHQVFRLPLPSNLDPW